MSDLTPHLPPATHAHRKRVVAREVSEAEVERVNQESAAIVRAEVEPVLAPPAVPEAAAEAVTVVDPTTLGRRYRKSSHHRLYRWTQVCTMLAAGLATASIFTTLGDDPHLGRWIAGPGLGVGIVGSFLSGQSSLSERWRGWAIAATVFAGVALGMTWVHDKIAEDEPAPRVTR